MTRNTLYYDAGERLDILNCIKGKAKADLIVKNGFLVNVLTGEILDRDVAIISGRVGSVGEDLANLQGKSTTVIDASGLYLVPGFIDAHLHIESSMLTPVQFAKLMAKNGVTSVCYDPHEIANVEGLSGVRWMVDEIGKTPLNGFLMVPSCIPASSDKLETTGGTFGLEEIQTALDWDSTIALGEMMNYPGVLTGEKSTVQKIEESLGRNLSVEGHASGLSGVQLDGYGAIGIDSDHEGVSKSEGIERARKGFWTYVREGSGWADLTRVITALTETDLSSTRFCLVTDDRDPIDLLSQGGVDFVIKRAIEEGLEPVKAYRMATLNPATRFGLDRDLGCIAPGRRADINLIRDLKNVEVTETLISGVPIGDLDWGTTTPSGLTDTVHINQAITPQTFRFSEKEKQVGIRVHKQDILTEKLCLSKQGTEERQLNKCVVIERHNLTGNVGKALVQGFDLGAGAVASTVAHDNHNLIVLGEDRSDMALAASQLISTGGGQVVVQDGEVKALVKLPAAGLMSDKPPQAVADSLTEIKDSIQTIGCNIPKPLMILSSLSLPVIPEARITDKGLVDVNRQKII